MKYPTSYTEKLSCGGSLNIKVDDWHILYCFPGPDGMNNGTTFTMDSKCIHEYVQAIRDNWQEFMRLAKIVPVGGIFSKDGKMGMRISVGENHSGVYINYYNLPIHTDFDLRKYISSYEYAAERVVQIQKFLIELIDSSQTDRNI